MEIYYYIYLFQPYGGGYDPSQMNGGISSPAMMQTFTRGNPYAPYTIFPAGPAANQYLIQGGQNAYSQQMIGGKAFDAV